MNNVLKEIKEKIGDIPINEESKELIKKKIIELENNKLNIMITGATGSGKSSTINSIFNEEVAEVGVGVNPETMGIKKYKIDNIILWDTPGLGDDPQKDNNYAKEITELLNRKDSNGKAFIDLVLVVIDGSVRDMKTSFEVINEVILPNMYDENRILVAINQCDLAMKGRGWNRELNVPENSLLKFLDEKCESVEKRIYESTGIHVKPIYYSALYHYNISKLLCYIIKSTPDEKRIIYADKLNKDSSVWKNNDDLHNYAEEIRNDMKGSIMNALDYAAKGAVAGATVGSLIPVIGPVIGAGIGALLGFLGGISGN
ncbi:GTPase [Clostridium sp. 3-3]|uniref:GTPase n=1 Tax=Clostridium sp. 3-3 TaxID=2070757 RepID=UPI000CDABDE3|nr:GTPase [Clostridium sp. 3-3]POO87537.1 GTP-binding protein [Clostridium sp. 3-3]